MVVVLEEEEKEEEEVVVALVVTADRTALPTRAAPQGRIQGSALNIYDNISLCVFRPIYNIQLSEGERASVRVRQRVSVRERLGIYLYTVRRTGTPGVVRR